MVSYNYIVIVGKFFCKLTISNFLYIVILIILATVSINVLLGEGGLINQAKLAGSEHKLAEYKEKFELAKAKVVIDNLGDVPIDDYIEEIKNEGIATEDQIKDNGDGSYTVTPEPGIDIIIKPTEDGKDVIVTYPDGTEGGGQTPSGVQAQSIKLNRTEENISIGANYTLQVTFEPSNTSNKNLNWKTDDEGVATVNNGIITGIGNGTTTITATTTDGSNKSATCTINVEEAKTVSQKLKEGDYVDYVDKQGTTRTSVVLYDSTSEYGTQIITKDTVEDVELGNGKGSEQSSNKEDLDKAILSYNTSIQTLNTRAREYLNTDLASDARSVGAVQNNPDLVSTEYITRSDEYFSEYNGRILERSEDIFNDYVQKEIDQLKSLNLMIADKEYWFAWFDYTDYTNYWVTYVGMDGEMWALNSLFDIGGYGDQTFWIFSRDYSCRLRPVFILKPEVKVIGGLGTEESPYRLGV